MAESRRSSPFQPFLIVFLALHIVFPAMWLAVLSSGGPRQNDWKQFHLIAQEFVAGRWADLYTQTPRPEHPGFLWRHPPYALYAVAPLAWMSPSGAYAALAAIELAALILSVVLLARLASDRYLSIEWVLAVLLSAPALTTVITGQISGLLLLCVVAAAFLWTRGRIVAACAVLGLLALKPNFGVFFGCYVLVRRQWRGLAAMLAGVGALCALTIPLGGEVWADFIRVSLSNIGSDGIHEPYKFITLKGFLNVVLGSTNAAFLLWAAAAAVMLAVTVSAWLAPGPPVRHLALASLLGVAANPYGFFYDALILTLPATVWWWEREHWRRGPWLVTGALIAIAWCWEHSAYTWNEMLKLRGVDWIPPFSVVGPVATFWLLIAIHELRRQRIRTIAGP